MVAKAKTRSKKLTPKRRSEIARRAARARWDKARWSEAAELSDQVRCPCCRITIDPIGDPSGRDAYLLPLHKCGRYQLQFVLEGAALAVKCRDARALRRTILKGMQIDPWPYVTSEDLQN